MLVRNWKNMEIDKSLFKDKSGKPCTQTLFLELKYDTDFAVYSVKDQDYEYQGKLYPSIKRLYLQMEDVTEYEFANKYFLGWNHWQRMCENKLIRKEIDEWREELEIKLRARAVQQMIAQASTGSYQASKWLADRGWSTRAAGRPSKLEIDQEKAKQERIADEYGFDINRLRRVV